MMYFSSALVFSSVETTILELKGSPSTVRDNMIDDFTHISTGGGASLQLMSGKQLPSLEALHEYV